MNPFMKPLASDLINKNLEEYARHLVLEEAAAAYHRKMAEYYREGIERLKATNQ